MMIDSSSTFDAIIRAPLRDAPSFLEQYNGAKVQLLDLPGIVEGAHEGKGRGRQVIAVARTADLILMMLDSAKAEEQRCVVCSTHMT